MSIDATVPVLVQAIALSTMLLERLEQLDGIASDDFLIELRATSLRLRQALADLSPSVDPRS